MTDNKEIPVFRYDSNQREKFPSAWWTAKKEEVGQAAWAKMKAIRDNQSTRRQDFLRYARLYANRDFEQFIGGVDSGFMGRRLTFNVSRACTDSACAKISKAKTRPLILTNKGNNTEQTKAKKLTQYLDGMFDQTKIYSHARRTFRDGCVFGTGFLKVYKEAGKCKVERVLVDELSVDDFDGRNLAPREMHQVKPVPREVLLDIYKKDPKAVAAISEADSYWELQKNAPGNNQDLLAVVESWHLPSGDDDESKDGRHIISLPNFTLLDEPWTKNYFPFIPFHWNEPLVGYYGEGIVEQLVGIQLEINTVLIRIKESQEVVAVPRVLVEESSNINGSHLTDEIGGIVRYRGTKPEFTTPIGLTRETYDYLEYMYRKSFEECGISQLSATSKKPAGLDSKVALREYQDIETERFILVGERYQTVFLTAAKMMIDIQRELVEEGEDPSVHVKGKEFIETIKWSDVDMDDDCFVMTAYPTNFLPRTPEGQLEFAEELIQGGLADPQEAMSLLDFPDLKGFMNIKTAARDDVMYLIEQMVEHGNYTPPEPYMDLAMAVKMVQSAYLRSKTDGTPEERQELLRRFIDACQDIMVKASEPPDAPLMNEAAGAPATPMQPGSPLPPNAIGVPNQAPVSDLMPIPTQQ